MSEKQNESMREALLSLGMTEEKVDAIMAEVARDQSRAIQIL